MTKQQEQVIREKLINWYREKYINEDNPHIVAGMDEMLASVDIQLYTRCIPVPKEVAHIFKNVLKWKKVSRL